MIISYETLHVLMRDWIKVEEALTHGYIGKFRELGCFPSGIAGEGFGFTYTYLPTNYSKETGTIYARRALNEEKWLIFTDHLGFMDKPVIEICDDRIDVHLDEDRLNGWKKDRIHSLYKLLKPYVLFDIDESSMDERNAQAVVLGRCVTNWLEKNRPFFADSFEPGSELQNWSITYASDNDNYISWDIAPSFKIRMVTGNHAIYYLYGKYIPHDNSDMDDKPYWIISDHWIISDQEINLQTEPTPMFIYIYRNHIEYKRPGRDDCWYEVYMKGLTDDIRAAMKGATIPDCSHTIKRLYESGALKYERAEESLTTKRGQLVRQHNNSDKTIIDSMGTKLDKEEGNSMKISIDDVFKHVETWVAQFKEEYVSEGGVVIVQHLDPCPGQSAYKEGHRISFRQPDNGGAHLVPFDLTIRKIHTSDSPDSIRIYNPAPGVPYENAIITIYDDRIEYFEKHDNIKWFDRISMFNLYLILVLALDDHEIAYDNIVSKSLLFSYMHKWVAPKIEMFMGDLRSPDAERRSFRAVYNIGYWSSFHFNFHEDRDICPISKILNVELFTLYRGCLGPSNRWHICTRMDGNQILAIIRERDSEIRRCIWGPAKLCTLSANNRWSDSECEDLFKMLSHLVEEDARNHGFDSEKIPSVDKEDDENMNKLISQSELRSIMQKWIDPFIERYDVGWTSGGWEGGFCWFLGGHYSNQGRSIFAHLCNDKCWKIYQNGNQDTPCCEIYSNEIRIYDMSGNFDAFSLPEIKLLCDRIKGEYFEKNEKDDENTRIPGGQAIEYPGSATIDLKGITEKIVNAAVMGSLNDNAAVMGSLNDAIEILKKATGTVCDTPNATADTLPSMLKSMNRRDLRVVLNSTYGLTQAGVTVDHDDSSIYPDTKRGFSMKIMQNIKEVIVNPPATIVYWEDGTKTTSHCKDDEVGGFDAEIGLAICIAKKYFGDTERFQLEARRAAVRYERREKKKAKKASKKKTEETVTEAKPVAKKKPTPKKK